MIQQEPVDNRNVDAASMVELYSVYVQTIEKVIDRREDTNKFFITLLTGLLVLLSIIIELRGTAFLQQEALLIVGVVGILLCYIWRILLRAISSLMQQSIRRCATPRNVCLLRFTPLTRNISSGTTIGRLAVWSRTSPRSLASSTPWHWREAHTCLSQAVAR